MSITLFSSLPQRKKPYCSIKILLNQQIITMEEARLLYWYGDLSMTVRTLYPRYTYSYFRPFTYGYCPYRTSYIPDQKERLYKEIYKALQECKGYLLLERLIVDNQLSLISALFSYQSLQDALRQSLEVLRSYFMAPSPAA